MPVGIVKFAFVKATLEPILLSSRKWILVHYNVIYIMYFVRKQNPWSQNRTPKTELKTVITRFVFGLFYDDDDSIVMGTAHICLSSSKFPYFTVLYMYPPEISTTIRWAMHDRKWYG
jgi:hypothetical protein